jgi:hypothetical protein
MLSEICTTFQDAVEQLDQADLNYAARLGVLTQKLANDAAAEIADFPYGEPVALTQLCANLLQWLKSESQDPDDRQRRYGRQAATIDLLTFCHALAIHLGSSPAQQRERLDDHRQRIGDALGPLVP